MSPALISLASLANTAAPCDVVPPRRAILSAFCETKLANISKGTPALAATLRNSNKSLPNPAPTSDNALNVSKLSCKNPVNIPRLPPTIGICCAKSPSSSPPVASSFTKFVVIPAAAPKALPKFSIVNVFLRVFPTSSIMVVVFSISSENDSNLPLLSLAAFARPSRFFLPLSSNPFAFSIADSNR